MIQSQVISYLLFDLLIILTAGFISGVICRRFRLPMVVGYLLIGAFIGNGVLHILHVENVPETESADVVEISLPDSVIPSIPSQDQDTNNTNTESNTPHAEPDPVDQTITQVTENDSNNESELSPESNGTAIRAEHILLEHLAHLGANLLLFAIGLHFSPSELAKLWKYFLVGGVIQMFGTIGVVTGFIVFIGGDWKVGLMIGSAISLSSTVLVFKSLEDMGQATSPSGVRAIAILLFQDVAVVPLLVIIGILAALAAGVSGGGGNVIPSPLALFMGLGVDPRSQLLSLGTGSVIFVAVVFLARFVFVRYGVPYIHGLRSVELLVLFTMVLLIGISWVAFLLGLPGALGALAAGVILSETRLTTQITAVTISLRETFSAIFFVSLGALFDPSSLFANPVLTIGALFGCIFLKTAAATVAFRVLGLDFITSIAMGLGLSQLGELSFVLLSNGLSMRLIDSNTYQCVLFVALTSIILTPLFLNLAIRVIPAHVHDPEVDESGGDDRFLGQTKRKAVVIGLGPIGGKVAAYLESSGFDVGLVDMNPVNLHPFAQHGFRTISGNAADDSTLRLIDAHNATLIVVAIPDDSLVFEVVEAARRLNDHCLLVSRCRFKDNRERLMKRGADIVICGEIELGNSMVRAVKKLL
ncbi:MAG: cation:proton antiporter [Planctomycetaceae bacterium]|jgi:CPA2 family monovalent cation:H+ antiporter-2|nr:cation:proton antiporter [Planctomycetaceae bacterium]